MYGYYRRLPGDSETPEDRLSSMLDAVGVSGKGEGRFADEVFAVTVPGTSSAQSEDTIVHFDGYILNRSELFAEYGDTPGSAGQCAEDAFAVNLALGRRGFAMIDELNGVFNLCVYSTATRRLRLFNCRHGALHLYYLLTESCLAFAPEPKALLALDGCPREVDRLSISDMFNFGYIGGDRTLFRHIKLLPPASDFSVDGSGCNRRKYWDYRHVYGDSGTTRDEMIDEVAHGLRLAVSQCSARFDRVGVPLSGGLDSRTILACLASEGRQPTTYHCAWYQREQEIASQLSGLAGTELQILDPGGFDYNAVTEEGFLATDGDVHAHQFWLLPLARRAAKEVDVLFDGYLMDIFFGDTFLVLPEQGLSPIEAINGLWRRCRSHFVKRTFTEAFYREYEDNNRLSIETGLADIDTDQLSDIIHRFSFANRSNRYSVAPPNTNGHLVDYAFPALDLTVVELYLRIRPEWKVGAGFYREVLQRHFPTYAQVPWAKTGKPLHKNRSFLDSLVEKLHLRYLATMSLLRLSRGALDLSYKGDLNRLFRRGGSLRSAYTAVLDDERTFSRGIVDRRGYRRLVALIDRGWPLFSLLESLITVELWFRRFVDE